MKKVLVLAAAVSAVLLSGCATEQPAVVQEEPVQLVDRSVPNVTFTYATESIARGVKALNARIVQSGQFPKLTFELVNFTQAPYPIEYRIQWMDADGAPVLTTAPWLQTNLSGMEVKPIASLGKQVNAKAAIVTFRFPTSVEIYVPTPDPVEQMRIERQVIDDYNARLASGQLVLQ